MRCSLGKLCHLIFSPYISSQTTWGMTKQVPQEGVCLPHHPPLTPPDRGQVTLCDRQLGCETLKSRIHVTSISVP